MNTPEPTDTEGLSIQRARKDAEDLSKTACLYLLDSVTHVDNLGSESRFHLKDGRYFSHNSFFDDLFDEMKQKRINDLQAALDKLDKEQK